MLSGRRVSWPKGWQVFRRDVSCPKSQLEATGGPCIRIGEGRHGALVAQHEGTWTLEAQRDAIQEIRGRMLTQPTRHLHTNSVDGVHNMLMVLRFLHDFEASIANMQPSEPSDVIETEQDFALKELPVADPGAAVVAVPTSTKRYDRWSALELFCRPWVVSYGGRGSQELLRLEEYVPPGLRAMCAIFMPWGLPIGSVLAWVTLQSPQAYCRLHLRRIAGPRLVPWRIRLDGGYRVESIGSRFGAEALAEVVSNPAGICEVVKGDIPEIRNLETSRR